MSEISQVAEAQHLGKNWLEMIYFSSSPGPPSVPENFDLTSVRRASHQAWVWDQMPWDEARAQKGLQLWPRVLPKPKPDKLYKHSLMAVELPSDRGLKKSRIWLSVSIEPERGRRKFHPLL